MPPNTSLTLTIRERERLTAELRSMRETLEDNKACLRALTLHHEAKARLDNMRTQTKRRAR